MKFDCQIKDRKLLSDSDQIRGFVSTQKNGNYIMEIRKVRKSPSQTMKYLYKIYSILAKGLKLYPADVKDMVKTKLLHYETIKNPEGQDHIRFISTADYTQEQFNDAIQLVQHWGSINDIYIMDSEEYKLQFES